MTPADVPAPPSPDANGDPRAGGAAAAGGAPSPYDSIRPAGNGGPRAAAARRGRPGVLGAITNDFGLKVLALLLAALLWNEVRGRIQVDDGLTLEVDIVAPDGVRIAGPDRRSIKIGIHGSRANVGRFKSEFGRSAVGATLRIDPEPGQRSGSTIAVNDASRLVFAAAGADALTLDLKTPFEIVWHRVAVRKLRVALPFAPAPAGRPDLDVGVPVMIDSEVTVTAPEALLEGKPPVTSLTPDEVDVRALLADPLADLGSPLAFDLGFDGWRGADPLRSDDLCTIVPRRVRGSVQLKQRQTERLTNRVRILIEGVDTEDYHGFDVELRAPGAFDPGTQQLTAEVRGDPKNLDAMKATTDDWSYAVSVPRPPKPGEADVTDREVDAFLWFRAGTGPAVKIVGRVTLRVTLKKR